MKLEGRCANDRKVSAVYGLHTVIETITHVRILEKGNRKSRIPIYTTKYRRSRLRNVRKSDIPGKRQPFARAYYMLLIVLQPDGWDCSTQTSTTTNGDKQDGCTYLQAVRAQLDSYQTTGGEYLEAIFTHRAVFNAYPPGHKSCAKGFSDIACALERRAWRADRDSDAEAVVAFRYEAWKIATLL